jgi:hypothetical protein
MMPRPLQILAPTWLSIVRASARSRAIFVVVGTDSPHPRPPLRRDQSYEDAANENAVGDHVKVVFVPAERRTHED